MSVLNRLREDPRLVISGLKNPALIGLAANQLFYATRQGDEFNRRGTDIFEEDWDNLVLLDACRYDQYADLTPFDGTPGYRESRGSASRQFIYGNFLGKTLHDVVYISGNQWYLKLKDELGAEIHAFHDVDRDAWDGYVPSPQSVTSTARALNERYPNKRLIIHYMQPHTPYLGEHKELFTYPRTQGLREALKVSEAGQEELLAAYRDNLRLVLEDVEKLVDELEGKTVISSDHGELLGDRLSPVPVRWYGHPRRIYADALVKVPWHVVSDGPRKDVVAERPEQELTDVDTEQVEENLRNLGYVV
jgi:hypothetical protein